MSDDDGYPRGRWLYTWIPPARLYTINDCKYARSGEGRREVEKESGKVVVLDGTTCQENSTPMIRENRQLVTVEPVEFEKYPVEVQDCRKITNHFRGIHGIYPILIKENRRMSTCNWLKYQRIIRLKSKTIGKLPTI